MTRAPFQVLVLPFRVLASGCFEFAALRRADDARWQAVAGGGEGAESPFTAAAREAAEELGLHAAAPVYRLDSRASIPVCHFSDREHWPADTFVIPEYSFAVDCSKVALPLVLSGEHLEVRWGSYDEVLALLSWESNRTALWELNQLLVTRGLEARLVEVSNAPEMGGSGTS